MMNKCDISHGDWGGGSEKRHNDVSRSKYRYVTLPLQSAEEKRETEF